MSVIALVVILVVLGVVAWLVNKAPMGATMKTIVNVVLVVVALLLVLSAFGVWDQVRSLKVPRL